jgi:cobalt-zinc-cadmium efflux system outer membrane protein
MRRHCLRAVPALALLFAATLPAAPALGAQDPALVLTRARAIREALDRGARMGVARADTTAALAGLLAARTFANPVLAASYSKSVPQYHVALELPFDYPWLRGDRVGSARAGRDAARFRFAFERAAVALDVDTTYTRALASVAHARLSRGDARSADSLRVMAIGRRDAGDASDLDVALATLNAGQQANRAAADSLSLASALLDLQVLIGRSSLQSGIVLGDSLAEPPAGAVIAGAGATLPVAAAEASFEAARLAARLERRSVFAAPGLVAGFETRDPTGGETGILPTFGVALPLPLLNRNRGAIVLADAGRERARAELALARIESQAGIDRLARERTAAVARVARGRVLVAAANRVAAMSLTAYREGAASLPNVIEAQRTAREVLGEFVDDLAAAWIADATLRTFTLTPASGPLPPR